MSETDIAGQLGRLAGAQSAEARFLGRYSRKEVEERLARAGISDRIRELGYDTVRLLLHQDEGIHVLRIESPGAPAALLDLRLGEEVWSIDSWLRSWLGSEPLWLLVVHWVALQNVRASFPEERPPLPGQDYPGLGAGRMLYRMLWRMGRELGKDALAAFPMYYHNAVYYSPGFCYLDPQKQGELVAMKRDLSRFSLHAASRGVEDGKLRDARTGRPLSWEPGVMVAALSPRLASFFGSEAYQAGVERAASASAFSLSPE